MDKKNNSLSLMRENVAHEHSNCQTINISNSYNITINAPSNTLTLPIAPKSDAPRMSGLN